MAEDEHNNTPEPPAETPEEVRQESDRKGVDEDELHYRPAPWMLNHRRQTDVAFEDENAWVLTYIDVFTLLLTLFVLMLSYAKTDAERYRELSESIAEEMGRKPPKVVEEQLTDAEQLARELKQSVVEEGILDSVDVLAGTGKVELRIKESILFLSGRANLRLGGGDVLDKLVPLLRKGSYDITVEGHTDNIPISTPTFPSNWELSVARATNVLRHLIDKGIAPSRLRAVGFADTQPIADNATAEGRAQNRRVTLLLEMEAGKKKPALE